MASDYLQPRDWRKCTFFLIDSFTFFVVDTCVLQCYNPQKDKLFGGESPNELQKNRE
jgi:hypothetical protein